MPVFLFLNPPSHRFFSLAGSISTVIVAGRPADNGMGRAEADGGRVILSGQLLAVSQTHMQTRTLTRVSESGASTWPKKDSAV